MISEQDLRDAARACEKAILASLPEPEDCPASFSPGFERRMRRLIFRTSHPVLFWLLRLLPGVLLLGAAVAGVLLSAWRAPGVPAHAQEEAPGAVWIYRPAWVPEDWQADREDLDGEEGMIVYKTAGGGEAVFLYSTREDQAETPEGEAVSVGGRPGVLLLGQTKGEINDLFWSDGAGAYFWLSAASPEEILIRVAESVEAQEMPGTT